MPMYDIFEKALLSKFIDTLDNRNLALISSAYAKGEKGSGELWARLNQRLVEI